MTSSKSKPNNILFADTCVKEKLKPGLRSWKQDLDCSLNSFHSTNHLRPKRKPSVVMLSLRTTKTLAVLISFKINTNTVNSLLLSLLMLKREPETSSRFSGLHLGSGCILYQGRFTKLATVLHL